MFAGIIWLLSAYWVSFDGAAGLCDPEFPFAKLVSTNSPTMLGYETVNFVFEFHYVHFDRVMAIFT